jgi:hypothetical protein
MLENYQNPVTKYYVAKSIYPPVYIHRLVALAFIPNHENKRVVDHINRNRTDNRVENLRWVTHSENKVNTGLYKCNKLGHKNITAHRDGGFDVQVRRDGVLVYRKHFKDLDEAIMERDLFLLFQ